MKPNQNSANEPPHESAEASCSNAVEQLKTTCAVFEKVCEKLVNFMEQSNKDMKEVKSLLRNGLVNRMDRLLKIYEQREDASPNFKNPFDNPDPLSSESQFQKASARWNTGEDNKASSNQNAEAQLPQVIPRSQNGVESPLRQIRTKMSARVVPTSTTSPVDLNSSFEMYCRTEPREAEPVTPTTPILTAHQNLDRPNSPAISSVSLKKPRSFLIKAPEDNKEEFLKVVRAKIGEFYANLTEQLYEKFTKREITYKELKVRFSWAVESYGFDQTEVFVNNRAGREWLATNKDVVKVVGLLNSYHKNTLEYLVQKYPPNHNKIVDTDLSRKIKEIYKHAEPQYEMLHNAGMSFSNKANKVDFTKDIKIWLNMLIKEVKKEYPKFSEKMRSVFLNHESSLSETDTGDMVEYEIGTKISEVCPYYTEDELDQPELNLKNPDILRVLTKWIEDLIKYFENTPVKVLSNKGGFKSTAHGQSIVLSYKRKESLAEKLDQIFKKEIKNKQEQNHRDMLTIIADLYIMLENGFTGCEEINEREVKTGKIAEFFSDAAATYTQKMLNDLISNLNSVSEMYGGGTLESGLDLVNFGVMDILRCRCVGSKQQIFRVYNEICEMKEYLEVIRVKNKLKQSTRDILINFKLKDSFMICEMQLALGKSREEINDNFCHNLYEVVRSAYPVLIEHGIRIAHYDPRSNYFRNKQVTFNSNERTLSLQKNLILKGEKVYCCNSHPEREFSYVKNNIPFCCYYCASYIKAFSFSIEFARCPDCMQAVCPSCLLSNFKELQYPFLNRYVELKKLEDFIEHEPYYTGFCCSANMEKILKEALHKRSYVFAFKFDSIGLKKSTFKIVNKELTRSYSSFEELKIRKIRDSKFNWNTVVLPKAIKEVSLEELKYYQKCTMVDLGWYQMEKILKNHGITRVRAIINKAAKRALIVDGVQTEKDILLVRRKQSVIRKLESENQKADISIEITNDGLTDLSILQLVKNKQAVRSINLAQNQIESLEEIAEFKGLQELHIPQNRVSCLQSIVHLENLQYLNCQRNRLKAQMPALNFQAIRGIDLSYNNIVSIAKLQGSSLPHLRIMILSYNKIAQTSKLNLPSLQILDLSSNEITSIDLLVESYLPSVLKVDLSNNRIGGALPITNFRSLEVLKLEHNKIQDVANFENSELHCLEILWLGDNQITGTLPAVDMRSLEKVDLSMNKIEDVKKFLSSQAPKLKFLDLSHNSISGSLPRIVKQPALQTLNLSFNHLSEISSLADSRLDFLVDLNIQKNDIATAPLMDAENLRNLNLSQNKICDVFNLEHCILPRLQTIDLSMNRIGASIPVLFMPELISVNLDSNDVTELKFLEEKQLVPKLQTVLIKYNKRLLIKDNSSEDDKINISKKSITFKDK